MRRFSCCLVCGLLLVASSQLAAQEIAKAIPGNVLVACVVKDMNVLHARMMDVAGKFDENAALPDFWNALLDSYDLQAQQVKTKPDGTQFLVTLPTTVDRKKPMAFLVTDPGQKTPDKPPVAIMLPVTDYKQFLEEIASVRSTEDDTRTPAESVDGFDLIGDEAPGRGTYFLKRGSYAILADSPDVLKAVRKDTGNLLDVLPTDARKLFNNSDAVVYANPDQAAKTFRKDLKEFVKTAVAQMKQAREGMDDEAAAAAGMPDPEVVSRILNAEVDILLELGEQTDSVVTGLNIDKRSIRLTGMCCCKANSMLGRCLAAQRPAPGKLMNYLDNNAWMAGGFSVTPGSLKELQKRFVKFIKDADLKAMLPDLNIDELLKNADELGELMEGETAFALYPPATPQGGFIQLVEIVQYRDANRAKTLARTQAKIGSMTQFPTMPGLKFKTTLTENVEPGIDRVVTELLPPQNPDPNTAPIMMMMQIVYGGKAVVHSTAVDKYMVVTLGDPTTKTIKDVVARLKAGNAGTLMQTPGYKRVIAELPQTRSGVFYFSLPRLMRAIVPIAAAMQPGMPQPNFVLPAPNTESAIMATLSFKGTAAQYDVLIPIQELVNVKNMVQRAMEEMMANMGGGDF